MDETIDSAILARESVRLGLVADTHVPDRVGRLHPALVPALRAAGVDVIIHLGDICERGVLETLQELAPVLAVRGNRDWASRTKLPKMLSVEIHGKVCVFLHGHGGFGMYLRGKVWHALEGYQLERHLAYFRQAFQQADVIAFGHTHVPENIREDGKLIFNPGSASVPWCRDEPPGYGVIEISRNGEVAACHNPLTGFTLKRKRWCAST
ncbi:MAG: metallophosphoesterase family protein [Anaerolineae bacterium]|nr:metallophosphoesterase family protein [Anaerolineae bacterium]